jgi:hypothetical protein
MKKRRQNIMIGSIGRKKSVLNGERVYIRAIGLLSFYRAICRSRELCATPHVYLLAGSVKTWDC